MKYYYTLLSKIIINVVALEMCPVLSLEGGTVESNGTLVNFSRNSERILFGSESAACNSEGNWIYNNEVPACIGKEIH